MPQLARTAKTGTPRRRRSTGAPMEKTALTFHAGTLDAVDAAVGAGLAPNRSAFVEAAVEEKLTRTRRATLYQAYAAAAQDPAFLADMQAVEAAFDRAAGDGL